ncbi:RmlC-like cupin domain-containing protein [Auriculariales sp. MPI-PUGE-AT-0066]|nr:RmlC-like cupin domain-containing protein [Auriculariales sp. MPI-PUGE-AT-0066]
MASLPTNAQLIKDLSLQRHPEGGYFAETLRTSEVVSSPFADSHERSLTTAIYYLLTPDSPKGVIHRNKSLTVHVLHHGRSLYTLIKPGPPGAAPTIRKVVMGDNAQAGEVRQLVVGGDEWKMSEIPDIDLRSGKDVGCLITEVVVPGFYWEDHEYLTQRGLEALFASEPENIALYASRVKN